MKKLLKCGCCGQGFRDEQDQEHDKGFGMCPRCRKEEKERNEEEWQKAEAEFASSLNRENRYKFWRMEKELRRGIILKAIEDGIMVFTIGGRQVA